jgi:hypothetical protein
MSPNVGGVGELRGLSLWVQLYTGVQIQLWRSNSIFNLGLRAINRICVRTSYMSMYFLHACVRRPYVLHAFGWCTLYVRSTYVVRTYNCKYLCRVTYVFGVYIPWFIYCIIRTCTYIVQNICSYVDYVVILLSELSFFFKNTLAD